MKAVRIAIDICLALALVMTQATALAQDFAHEWAGIVTFLLVIAHITVNWKRTLALLRGKKTPSNVATLVLDGLLVVAVAGLIASSVVLSEHVFSWLPVIPGAFWARTAHLLCSYWLFALAFVHAGAHIRKLPKAITGNPVAKWAFLIAIGAASIAGAYFFIELGISSYMTLQVQFVFVDFSVLMPLRFAQWLCIGIMFATLAHLVAAAARC